MSEEERIVMYLALVNAVQELIKFEKNKAIPLIRTARHKDGCHMNVGMYWSSKSAAIIEFSLN